jgi:hypothetical protein
MIEAKRLIYQASDGGKKFFSYRQNSNPQEKKITEIILSNRNDRGKAPIHLKIRPHIALSSLKENGGQETNSSCQIKVFQYENQKDAKLDKYMSWDIYQRK